MGVPVGVVWFAWVVWVVWLGVWHGDLTNYAHIDKVSGKLWIKLVWCVNKVVDKRRASC